MDKLEDTPTGSSSSDVKKRGKGNKMGQKMRRRFAKKREMKKSEIVSVEENANAIVKDVNAEEESKIPEDFEAKVHNQEVKVMTHTLKKVTFKDDDRNVQTPSDSNDQVVPDATGPNDDLEKTAKESDIEFNNFLKILANRANTKYTKVTEITQDLFKMSKDYSLAHCVAQDLNMSSGIAAQFSLQFKRHGDLSNQRQKPGGLAILNFPPRFIYYLVTKKFSNGKPSFHNLWDSVTKMQKHVQANDVKQVAIPRLGCGLDRLKWTDVKFMIQHIFQDTDVKITVCNFLQKQGVAPVRNSIRKCMIVNICHSVREIQPDTMIVYFGTEDGFATSAIKKLDKKFHIISDYKRGPRVLGQVVRTDAFNGKYVVFGFIVKKTTMDVIDYICVQKCAKEVNAINKQFGENAYEFLAFNVFEDPPDDEMQFHQVLNILRSTLIYVDIHVCYPKDLMHLMPKKREHNL